MINPELSGHMDSLVFSVHSNGLNRLPGKNPVLNPFEAD